MISRRLPSIHGVDIYSVKSFLGHRRIETTERYLHFVAGHAEQAVRAAQEIERVDDLRSGKHWGICPMGSREPEWDNSKTGKPLV